MHDEKARKQKKYSTGRIKNAPSSNMCLKYVRVFYGLVYRFHRVLRGPRVVREFHSRVLCTGTSVTEHSFQFLWHVFLLFLLRSIKFQFHTATNKH